MKYIISIILFTTCLFSQYILTTKSGETYRGRYLGELDDDRIKTTHSTAKSLQFPRLYFNMQILGTVVIMKVDDKQ